MHHGQNASQGKDLIKLKSNTGTRMSVYKLAMGEFGEKKGESLLLLEQQSFAGVCQEVPWGLK